MHAARTIELPVAVVIGLLWRENAGELPAVLAGGEEYVSPRFRQEADLIVEAELARAGVRLDGEFRVLLTLIQHATAEFFGWVQTGTESYGVLAAGRGRVAMRLVRRGDWVTLARADPDRLAQTVVSLLPDVPPARGASISVRATDFAPPGSGGFTQPVTSGRPHEARRLDDLLRRPRQRCARLYAAARDDTGTRRRSADSLTVLDVAGRGRWLVYFTAGAGDRAINAVPGTPALIAGKLTDLRPPGARK